MIRQPLRIGAVPGAIALLLMIPLFPPPASSSVLPDNTYTVTALTSDGSVRALSVDSRLINPWGLARSPSGPWWVADNGTSATTTYDANGKPLPAMAKMSGAPTGVVYNGSDGFVVTAEDGTVGPARFLFATEQGTITAWMPGLSSNAVVVNDASRGAIYKGIALLGDILYATDFHNGRVDMFDTNFNLINSDTGDDAFSDPNMAPGFAPFGIQAIGERIFVTYAMQGPDAEDDVAGPGLGFVNVFDAAGHLISRVASKGALNAPWGIAQAPDSFGGFGGALLIANFGDGRINAYDAVTFSAIGYMKSDHGMPVAIDGLWGIAFGNDGQAGSSNVLYFTAGPGDEEHGVFGSIAPSARTP